MNTILVSDWLNESFLHEQRLFPFEDLSANSIRELKKKLSS